MSYRQTQTRPYSNRGFQLRLQPALPWTAILGFIFLSTLLILVGVGKIVNLFFPVGAFAVGVLLYFRAPILYLGFTWWLWFLAPLVRRLADWQSGFTEPSPILLAPYLATLVTLFTLWQYLLKSLRQGGLPFVLSFASIFYGISVGLIYHSPVALVKGSLEWLCPVLFGFHLFVNWQNYPIYRQNTQQTFLWGTLVMGAYGVIQYLVAPEWDQFWMANAPISSVGIPEPLGIRVWSTMNSPGPFGVVMMAGLLLLFNTQGTVCLSASVVGYLSFLLSLSRKAWGGWLVGMFVLVSSLKPKLQMRLIIVAAVMAVLILPLTTIEPFSEVISSRLETFSNIEDDGSANDRIWGFQQNINSALTNFLGWGIGVGSSDSGIISMFSNLGWLGLIFYMSGLLLLLFRIFQGSESRFDPFLGAARAIAVGVFTQLPLASSLVDVYGMLLWGFLGIAMAGNKYHRHQLTLSRVRK